MSVYVPNKDQGNLILPYPLHHSLKRAYDRVLKKTFSIVIQEQNILQIAEHSKRILGFLTNNELKARIENKWNRRLMSSKEKWDIFEEEVRNELLLEKDKKVRIIKKITNREAREQ